MTAPLLSAAAAVAEEPGQFVPMAPAAAAGGPAGLQRGAGRLRLEEEGAESFSSLLQQSARRANQELLASHRSSPLKPQ